MSATSSLNITNVKKLASLKTREPPHEEQYTLLKPLEVSTSSDIIYSILIFLEASPLTPFIGAPENGVAWHEFFQEVFSSFKPLLVSDDERVRNLSSIVALRLLTDGTMTLWHRSKVLGNRTFRYSFWQTT